MTSQPLVPGVPTLTDDGILLVRGEMEMQAFMNIVRLTWASDKDLIVRVKEIRFIRGSTILIGAN